jgi:NADH dehydrogenase (ubiquinone) 1 alpha subcomplex subunit 5
MFRLTRPLFNAVKRTTGITGLSVHPNPLPELVKTYKSTLGVLANIPETSVYRQGVEALTQHKLSIVESANGDVAAVELKLNEGQIEEALDVASDELSLASKMLEWKAYVVTASYSTLNSRIYRWEPLEEKPEPGQWEYIGQQTTVSSS